ncbi:MAG: LppC family lipoprotein, partial [Methylomonas sp.]
MPRRWLICRFFCLLTLIGCSNEAVKPEAGQQTSPQRQAKKPPAPTASSNALASTQALQHLQNAEAYIRSGNNAPATQELDIINYASLSS